MSELKIFLKERFQLYRRMLETMAQFEELSEEVRAKNLKQFTKLIKSEQDKEARELVKSLAGETR
jgi:hypothetical protein